MSSWNRLAGGESADWSSRTTRTRTTLRRAARRPSPSPLHRYGNDERPVVCVGGDRMTCTVAGPECGIDYCQASALRRAASLRASCTTFTVRVHCSRFFDNEMYFKVSIPHHWRTPSLPTGRGRGSVTKYHHKQIFCYIIYRY